MGKEERVIAATPEPRTRETLAADFRRLGLGAGMTVLVHSSLSSMGWISGGKVAVIQALQDVLTPGGTLVMPAHSGDMSDPAEWIAPPVPASWWPVIRATMPAYDARLTPTSGMGCIAELFRTWPGVVRSNHPQVSFAAWGRLAERVTANHELAYPLGEGSPLARLYEVGAWVLLLGVGYGNNTSFHLAQYRANRRHEISAGAPIVENGKRVWKVFTDIEAEVDDFEAIGADLERTDQVKYGQVGSATARFFPQPPAVDFATRWLNQRYP